MARPFLKELHTTSGFGPRIDPFDLSSGNYHEGVDFRANYDTLYAPEDCTVLGVGNDSVSGLYVQLAPDSEPEIYLAFCHLSNTLCDPGERLTEGTVFGITGNTGRSTAPHLHFGVRRRSDRAVVDPTNYLQKIASPILAGVGPVTLPGLALVAVGIGLFILLLGGNNA